jgi:acyl-CoA oxidase
MMVARVSIVAIAYDTLAQATTIAVRYSAVRRQGFKDTGTGQQSAGGPGGGIGAEHVVLDYQMQQYRLFKALSLSYCLLWNKRYIIDYIRRVRGAIDGGDESAADGLPELHATLSGMKAAATVWAHEGIEECRKCCGGQGFLKVRFRSFACLHERWWLNCICVIRMNPLLPYCYCLWFIFLSFLRGC